MCHVRVNVRVTCKYMRACEGGRVGIGYTDVLTVEQASYTSMPSCYSKKYLVPCRKPLLTGE